MIYQNTVILQGYLGADCIVRKLRKTGEEVLNLSIGVSEKYKDQNSTSWHSVTVFHNVDKIKDFLRKGTRVAIVGKLKSKQYVDNSGETHYSTEIHVHNYDSNLMFENKKDAVKD